jgi:hypothetical protein
MNITKQMLRFGVAALAMVIGSQALAAPIISESFEGRANGSLVTNNLLTSAWTSTGGDLSVITNMGDYGYTATSFPLTSLTPTIWTGSRPSDPMRRSTVRTRPLRH